MKTKDSKKVRRQKCVKVGYDCRGGTHKVDLGHGDSVKLCDGCYRRWQEGQ